MIGYLFLTRSIIYTNFFTQITPPHIILSFIKAHKGLQRFESLEHSDWLSPGQAVRGVAPRQRLLYIDIVNKKVSWVKYNQP